MGLVRLIPILAVVLGVLSGCGGGYYTVVKQTAPSQELRSYKQVSVGWLDLGEERYKNYGYDEKNKNQWIGLVRDVNTNAMPRFLKELMPAKTVKTVKSKGELPPYQGLVVLFSDARYNQQTSSAAQIMFGRMAGSDTMDVTVRFIDGATKKEIYSSTINVSSAAGMDMGSMAFEGRLNNTIYNLSYYIYEKTK